MLPASTIRELEELDRHLDNVHSGLLESGNVQTVMLQFIVPL